jgi:hypothetical protein
MSVLALSARCGAASPVHSSEGNRPLLEPGSQRAQYIDAQPPHKAQRAFGSVIAGWQTRLTQT